MTHPLAGPQGLLWTLNARAVLDVLDAGAPLGRPELVTATGLSRTTVAQTVAALTDDGVIVEAGIDHTRRGPAAQLYRISPDRASGLALHVGAGRVSAELIDLGGTVLARRTQEGAADDPRRIVDAVRACIESAPTRPPLRSVSVAVGGIVGPDLRTLRTVTGYATGGTALHDALADAFDCEVRIENDVNAAALAEHERGAGAGLRDFVLLSLESGFGAAVVIDGRLRRGSAGGAGEVSYLPQPGVPLGEPVLGGAQIAALAAERGLPPEDGLRAHLRRAHAGDAAALDLLDDVASRIALAAASVALVLEPEAFVLGRLAADPLIVAAVRRFADTSLQALPLVFVSSPLGEDDSLIGAAGHVRAAIREQVFGEATRAPSTPDVPHQKAEADDDRAAPSLGSEPPTRL